MSGDVGME